MQDRDAGSEIRPDESPAERLERAAAETRRRRPSLGAASGRPSGESSALRRLRRRRWTAYGLGAVLLLVLALTLGLPVLLGRGELTVLVVGKDDTAGGLADTILFVHADLARGETSVLAVPRDTRLTGPDGRQHKANALFARQASSAQAAHALHLIAPEQRVVLTSRFLPRLVDAVGGVEVDVGPVPLNSYDTFAGWHIHIPAGRQHLTGEQAFGYARFRKPRRSPCPICGGQWSRMPGGDASDLARMARQQQLISAVLAKLRDPWQFWRLPGALDASRQLHGTLSTWQALALGNCLRRDGSPEFLVYPTEIAGRRLMPRPDILVARADGGFASLLAGRVVVRNGTGAAGLGARVALALSRRGFIVAPAENAARTQQTVVEGPVGLSRSVQRALGYGVCRFRDSKDVVVTLGLDSPNPE